MNNYQSSAKDRIEWLDQRVVELERDLAAERERVRVLEELLVDANHAMCLSDTCQDEIDAVRDRITAALAPPAPTRETGGGE